MFLHTLTSPVLKSVEKVILFIQHSFNKYAIIDI
nr:MAG TPA: hypothetical protein [Caudoviricetes sp.]